MELQLPADIDSTIKAFLAAGKYENEAAVLREALASLQRRDDELAAIQAGCDDMDANRIRPWQDVRADIEAKHGFAGE